MIVVWHEEQCDRALVHTGRSSASVHACIGIQGVTPLVAAAFSFRESHNSKPGLTRQHIEDTREKSAYVGRW